jgi:hypothetical protein
MITFADSHGRDCPFDSIFALVAVLTVEINAELIVLAFPWSSDAHFEGGWLM